MQADSSVAKTAGKREEAAAERQTAPAVERAGRVLPGAVWLVAVGAALLLLPSLLYPFGRDQGVFTDVAQVLLRGGLPYRDVWDIKPPGIYLVYTAIVGLFGHRAAAIRATDLAIQIATVAGLYMLGRSLLGSMPAALGALWYAALYLRCGYWGMAQAEGFASVPVLLAIFLWLAGWRERRLPWTFGAGLLAGSAALLKYPAALPCVAAPAWAVLSELRGERRWQPLMKALLLTAAGAALPVIAAALWLRAAGAWDAYLEIQRGFVAPYAHIAYGGPSWWARGWSGTRAFAAANGLPCLLGAIGLVTTARSIAPRERSVLFGWLAIAIAAVWSQGKFFQYHWIPVLMPLGLLAGAGLWAVVQTIGARAALAPGGPSVETAAGRAQSPPSRTVGAPLVGGGRRRRAVGAGPRGVGEGRLRAVRARGFNRWVLGIASGIGLLTPIVWSLFGQWPAYRDGWRVVRGALPLADYQERFGQPYQGDYSYLADVWAAEYVRAATRPADGIFIWGFEPLVYVLSGRRPPTRFHFAVPLVSPWAPAGWRQELLRDLAARPPALFMVLRDDAIPWASGRADDSEQQLARFAGLRRFLQRHYRFERQIEHFAIYRRSSYR